MANRETTPRREIQKWHRSTLTCPAGHSRSFTCYGLMYECHDCYTGTGYGRKFYFVNGEPTFSESKILKP